MKLLITGRPGCGKTTLCKKAVEALRDKLAVGGVITEEIRRGGKRTGFKIMDLMTGEEMLLARKGAGEGPRVGRYVVNIEALRGLGEKALHRAVEECDLIVIDEVGAMELKSPGFAAAVAKAFNSEKQKHVIATMPLKSRHEIINELRIREDITLIEINPGNRNSVLDKILERIER